MTTDPDYPPPPYTPSDPHTPSSTLSPSSPVSTPDVPTYEHAIGQLLPRSSGLRGGGPTTSPHDRASTKHRRRREMSPAAHDVEQEANIASAIETSTYSSSPSGFSSAAAYFEDRPLPSRLTSDRAVSALQIYISPSTTAGDISLFLHDWQLKPEYDISQADIDTFANYLFPPENEHQLPEKLRAELYQDEKSSSTLPMPTEMRSEREARIKNVIAEWNESFFHQRRLQVVVIFVDDESRGVAGQVYSNYPSANRDSFGGHSRFQTGSITSVPQPVIPNHPLPFSLFRSLTNGLSNQARTRSASLAAQVEAYSRSVSQNIESQCRAHGQAIAQHMQHHSHAMEEGWHGRRPPGRGRDYGFQLESMDNHSSRHHHHHFDFQHHRHHQPQRRRSSSVSSTSSSSSSSSTSSDSSIDSIDPHDVKGLSLDTIRQSLANFNLDSTTRALTVASLMGTKSDIKLAVRELKKDLRAKKSEAQRQYSKRSLNSEDDNGQTYASSNATPKHWKSIIKEEKEAVKVELKSMKKEFKEAVRGIKEERKRGNGRGRGMARGRGGRGRHNSRGSRAL